MNSFSRKLTALFCLTVLAAMASTAFLTTRAVRSLLVKDLTESLSTQALLIADELNPADLKSRSKNSFHAKIIELADVVHCRVTIVSATGSVLDDSSVTFEKLKEIENHSDRPEIREALAHAGGTATRHSHTINEDLLYVAVPWKKAGKIIGVVRLAMPLIRVESRVHLVNRTIGWVSLGMIFLAVLIAFFLSRSISRPISEISAVIHDLAGGHYGARVRQINSSEHKMLALAVNNLADKIQYVISELARDKSQLSTILFNMVESVVAVDPTGKIVTMNPALASLFQIDETASRGKPFLEVLRHNQLSQLVSSVLQGGKTRVDEVRTFSPVERIFEAHAVPLIQEGKSSGALLVLHDITRLRQLEQLRREFVANVSHELRTPLASMKGYAETLRLGAIDDKTHRMEFLQSIESQAEQMTRLVDDLLDLAAIESGKRGLQLENFDPQNVAEEIVRNLKGQAAQKKIQIKVKKADVPTVVSADLIQIKQVFTNLLDNAIKFNKDKGDIQVSFLLKDHFIHTSVADNGPGIPSADVPRVFERFFRVDKARSRELGGTGLGLAIVKHIVEAHGGRVSLRSEEGQGSTFSFSLPLS